jgi:hypothetical protein
MTRIEEIKAKADELGQFYFPDECNVWARANIEARFVSSACIEMAEWMQRKMIEKATQWLFENVYDYLNPEDQERVESFRKYSEE